MLLPAATMWLGALAGLRGHWAPTVAAGTLIVLAGVLGRPVLRRAACPAGPMPSRAASRRVSLIVRVLATVALLGWCLAGGAVNGALRVQARDAGAIPVLAERRPAVVATVVITSDPRSVPASASGFPRPRTWAMGRLVHLAERAAGAGNSRRLRTPLLLQGSGPWPSLLPGGQVQVTGRLVPAPQYRAYAAILMVERLTVATSGGRLALAVEPLRRGLREAAEGLPSGAAGLLPALVVGDESQLDATVVADLHESGLSHLTAVSGANLAITVGAALAVAGLLGARSWALPVIGVVVLAAFVVVARPQPSVVRAAAMALVVLLAYGAGTRRAGLRVLGVAVVGLLLMDPWLAVSPGFALSVSATGGLLVLAPGWTRAATRWLPAPLAAALAVTVAAQVACAPLLTSLEGALRLAALPANILAEPAVAPATVLGVLAAVVSLVWPGAAAGIATLAGLPTQWIVEVAGWASRLPGAAIPASTAMACVGAVASGLALGRVLRSRALCLALALALTLLLVRPAALGGWPPRGWVAVMCDVGQGDAIAVRAGPQAAVVVDTGADPRAVDRCLRGLGVAEVPSVILTHFHADHAAGLGGVLAGRDVGQLLIGPLEEPSEQAAKVRSIADRHGIPIEVAAAGERRQAGWVSWRVLWPRRLLRGEGSAPNNASLVIHAEVRGVRLLLTGDVEAPAQVAIVGSGSDLVADVFKVPHHGSADQSQAFLAAAGAGLALVSVGAGNRYGHPDPVTLAALDALGMVVARTDRDGSLAVVLDGERIVHRVEPPRLRLVRQGASVVAPEP